MILTGVDTNHEDLIDWWLRNATTHIKDHKIGVWDFGMSIPKREFIKTHYPQVWLSMPLEKRDDSGWFYKLKALIEAPEQSVAWLDVDCEILTDISDVFNLVPPDMIGLTRDWVRGNWWATGVIVVNDRPKLLHDWSKRLNEGNIRGDQEALEAIVGKNTHEQIQELPQEYQWLRISLNKGVDSPTKKVIHWTGPVGREHIRKNLK